MSNNPTSIYIIIDNPVLLEILQRYKDRGLSRSFNLGFGVGTYVDLWGNQKDFKEIQCSTRTPAFYYEVGFEDDGWQLKPGFFDEGTEIIDKILEAVIIRAIDGILIMADDIDSYIQVVYDQSLYEQMKEELLERKAEINRAYAYVYLWNNQEMDGMGTFDEKYEYDPIEGETYSYEGDPEDWYY